MESMIAPDWPAPVGVKAFVSTRAGGVSEKPFDGFNLGAHVGDQTESVMQNREHLRTLLGFSGEIQWLNQVHGAEVVVLPTSGERHADAAFTTEPGVVCAVLTADCLPVLFCNQEGTQVAVAHAGWRGLCAGVLENTLMKFSEPDQVMAWLGPAIGPAAFEVGEEVRAAFMAVDRSAEDAFVSRGDGKCLGNLYQLARQRLERAGCRHVYGGGFCTFSDAERFYSYRRDGVTGRMATLIWFER